MAKSQVSPLVWVLGAGVGLVLLSKNGTGNGVLSPLTNALQSILPAGNNVPATAVNNDAQLASMPYNASNYASYIYPAMLRLNPNVGNADYTLTDVEADQYMRNYLALRQYYESFRKLPVQFLMGKAMYEATNTPQKFARWWWKANGVKNQQTFLPILPTDLTPKPPSFSAGDFLKIAASVAALIKGIDYSGKINVDSDMRVLHGAAIVQQILPFYDGLPGNRAASVEAKLNNALSRMSHE